MSVRNRLQALVVMSCVLGAARAFAQPENGGLRATWGETDHASGVYYAKSAGRLVVVVENPTGTALPLKGTVAFGVESPPHTQAAPGGEGGGGAGFTALSLTPIAVATVGPGERVRLNIPVMFEAAGTYGLRWVDGEKSVPIENAAGVGLQCIFAPRTGVHADERWVTALPAFAAKAPGYLNDLVARTGVKKYVLDERFAFDPANNIGLAMGASLGVPVEQVDALIDDAVKGKAELVLRVVAPASGEEIDPRMVAAFHRYIEDAVKRARGTLKAIVIVPNTTAPAVSPDGAQQVYERFYLAGYAAAKGADKRILMLGTGLELLTRRWLLDNAQLQHYVDGVAVSEACSNRGAGGWSSGPPIWELPRPAFAGHGADDAALWRGLSPAVALGEGASVVAVPPPDVDRGVTAHLLGGAVAYQKLHAGRAASAGGLPYCVSFQGDGYAVVAMAGLSAGTPLDAQYPQLAGENTTVTGAEGDDTPPYPHWEVGDDTGSLRVVDAAGEPVDCRRGDTLYVPAEDRVVYVLAGGSAEDLMGILKAGMPGKLPVVSMEALRGEGNIVRVRLTNITAGDVGGALRLLSPGIGGGAGAVIGEMKVVPVSAGKVLEVPVELTGELPGDGVVIGEVTTDGVSGVVQRTVMRVGAAK